jgi:hypothetical protein
MSFVFRPAKDFTDRHGAFVSLTGGTNSGKTYSALRLARGIAGPNGKIAVIDTEGGRTLHLKEHFDFDVALMDPPFRPHLFAEAAKAVEDAKYDACLFDSFSMEWVGIGGVLDWQEEELAASVERAKNRNDQRSEYAIREAGKMAAWIKPKGEHKAMVYSLLQRRIPIIFAIRGEETIKPGERPGDKPTKIFKSICSPTFPFEVTISFRLDSGRKGFIDLSDPKSWKMEAAHQAIFHDGEQINEEHGAALARWARGENGGSAQKPRATLADWIANTLTAHLADCKAPADIEKVTASKQYAAALEKANAEQKAEMARLVGEATERVADTPDPVLHADALIRSMEQAPKPMDWRKGPEVAREMAQLQAEAPAQFQRVEDAIAGRLNNPPAAGKTLV